MNRTLVGAIFLLCLCVQQVCNDSVGKKAVNNPTSSSKQDSGKDTHQTDAASKSALKPTSSSDGSTNSSANSTETSDGGGSGYFKNFVKQIHQNKDMLLRTMYVLIGITGIVVIYFVIRAWRIRRRRSKSRKYGIITTPGNDMEMEPLDQEDDDDEDVAVFEMNGRRK